MIVSGCVAGGWFNSAGKLTELPEGHNPPGRRPGMNPGAVQQLHGRTGPFTAGTTNPRKNRGAWAEWPRAPPEATVPPGLLGGRPPPGGGVVARRQAGAAAEVL